MRRTHPDPVGGHHLQRAATPDPATRCARRHHRDRARHRCGRDPGVLAPRAREGTRLRSGRRPGSRMPWGG
ncbi:hypothetical protein G6F35_019139 [Rhizopus arrhizus]|nr:hypothetical protein G6F35_019139 [Rhizopus arrhizus]